MYPGQHIPGNPILWWLNSVHPQLKATLDWQSEPIENNRNYIWDMNIYKLTKIQLYKWFNRTLQLQIFSWRIIIKTKIFIRSPQCTETNLFMKYDKLQTHCCAFINHSIFFAKITQFAWAISKNVREIRSSAWNYYTSEAHLELDTRAVRYIRWEKSSREERQERIKPVLDLETQLIVSILKHLVALHC